jgi:hypothetical protein
MAVRQPNAALIEHFERLLNSLQQTQIRKMEELFPQVTGHQKAWPPAPPEERCGTYYAGYPGIGTRHSSALLIVTFRRTGGD